MSKQIYKALTIAGTDPTGGAGIQADLKTFQELKSYGMSVITSVVAQNTLGVQDVHHVPLEMIKEQLQSVFSDVPVHAFKTGMIANIDMMKVIKEAIQNKNIPFVIDPVMVATSGDPLIDEDARDFLRDELFPLSMVVTPNLPEAEVIVGKKITTVEEMKVAAKQIVEETGTKAALVKGGHLTGDAKSSRFPFAANGRALSLNETDGFLKLVTREEDGLVIGAQIVGANASDIIAEIGLAIEAGMTAEDIALTIHAHPTLAEMTMEAADVALGKPIHTM